MSETIIATIRLRRGTAALWEERNPTPASGEPCYETDTGLVKIGNGTEDWNTLDYLAGAAITGLVERLDEADIQIADIDGQLATVDDRITAAISESLVGVDSRLDEVDGILGGRLSGEALAIQNAADLTSPGPVRDAADARVIAVGDPAFAREGVRPTAMVAAGSTHVYDQKASLYNFRPENTRRIKWSLARALSGAGVARWAFKDDSTGAGYPDPTFSPARQLLSLLEKRGYPVAGELVVANPGGAAGTMVDPRWTFSGPWTPQGGAASPNFVRTVASSGAWAKYTGNRKGDRVRTAHFCSAPVELRIDGVLIKTLPASAASTITYNTEIVTDDLHNVELRSTTGANMNVVYAGVGYITAGVEFFNGGTNSTRSADWLTSTYFYNGPVIATYNPHVTFIGLGHNDKNVGAGVPVATYKANLQAMITAGLAGGAGNVVLVAQNPNQSGDFADYMRAKYELADSNDIPLIDIYHRWGESFSTAVQVGFMDGADGAHPAKSGYSDIAAQFLAAVT